MAEAESARHWRRSAALATGLWLQLLAGCAPPSAVAPPAAAALPSPALAPAPPSDALLAAHADLLRLEDRRDFDPVLLERLAGDTVAAIRARTALALGRLREPEGSALLLRLLADADTAVAATAAFSLGQLGDSSHAAALSDRMSAAGDSAPTVAAEAAYALGKSGGNLAREALLELLRSRNLSDDASGPAVGSALLAIWKFPSGTDLDPITRWLHAPDPELRWRAAYALVRRSTWRALPRLRGAMADPDPRVRAQAVRGLTATAADSANIPRAVLVEELVPLLEDPSYAVAVNAARVLGSFTTGDVAQALADASTSPKRHLALAAIESLGRMGEAALPVAGSLAALAGADSVPEALRAAALGSLAVVDAGTAGELAARFRVSPSWRLRAASAHAYASMGGGPTSEVREALLDHDPRVANAALQATIDASAADLAALRPLLIEQLGAADPIVRSTALAALARIPHPSLLPPLLDAYARAQRDTLNDAALAALDAIGAISGEGTAPVRAFLARFPRAPDPLVRQRAVQRLDSAAVIAAWGNPLPIETGRTLPEYRELVERFVAPILAGGQPPGVVLSTNGDSLQLRLFAADAPLTVESFLGLAADGYFDGQEWPRVVPNFVVQGGDPRGDTSGGPGYAIRDEISRRRYGVGTLGMALAGPDTGGSQFFITHSPQPHLDGSYAVFGEVVVGQEATEIILPGDIIESIRRTR